MTRTARSLGTESWWRLTEVWNWNKRTLGKRLRTTTWRHGWWALWFRIANICTCFIVWKIKPPLARMPTIACPPMNVSSFWVFVWAFAFLRQFCRQYGIVGHYSVIQVPVGKPGAERELCRGKQRPLSLAVSTGSRDRQCGSLSGKNAPNTKKPVTLCNLHTAWNKQRTV